MQHTSHGFIHGMALDSNVLIHKNANRNAKQSECRTSPPVEHDNEEQFMVSTPTLSKNADYNDDLFDQYKSQFKSLSADDKLAALWYIYQGLGDNTVESPDDNKESDSSLDLYDKVKAKPKEEQLQFMRDILSGTSNDLTSAYGELTGTTKVALWYRLGHGMAESTVVNVPSDYSLSSEAKELVGKLNDNSFEQSYIFLRDILTAK